MVSFIYIMINGGVIWDLMFIAELSLDITAATG